MVPELQFTAAYATALVAILGTTISPYLFFWQCAEEVEDEELASARPLIESPQDASAELRRVG